jgi:hypothetical protein
MFFICIESRGEGIQLYSEKTEHKIHVSLIKVSFGIGVTFLKDVL